MAADNTGMDRRKHPRLTVTMDGAWRGLSGEGLCVFSDISLGGCFAYCSDTPSVGEEVTVTVHADRDIPLVAFRGTVRDVVSDPMARSGRWRGSRSSSRGSRA